jgi:hypothetical protein
VATLTFSAITRAIPVGTVITVTGMTPTGYNVSNVQVTASSTTSMSYALASNPGTFSSGGTLANGTTYTRKRGACCRIYFGDRWWRRRRIWRDLFNIFWRVWRRGWRRWRRMLCHVAIGGYSVLSHNYFTV